jgi:hypothetical protein
MDIDEGRQSSSGLEFKLHPVSSRAPWIVGGLAPCCRDHHASIIRTTASLFMPLLRSWF